MRVGVGVAVGFGAGEREVRLLEVLWKELFGGATVVAGTLEGEFEWLDFETEGV